MKLFCLGLAMLVPIASGPAAGYPISPRALRQLYTEADLVVIAKCGATTTLELKDDDWNNGRVVLTIEKTVKGKEQKEVTVAYCPNMI